MNVPETFECGWLVATGFTEDGDAIIRECGAVATIRPDQSGWDCEAGHEHTTMEARFSQGWDYFDEDEIEAARHGVFHPAIEMRPMS